MPSTSDARRPVELLADEFLARCKRGEKPTIKEYSDRHPELADEIRDVFEAVLMVEDLKPAPDDTSGPCGDSVRSEGKRLDQVGDYRILREVGRGGMGVVYEAEQQALGRRVALKVLPRTSAGDSSAQVRFQREARAAARMHHTNIVPVFDVGQDGERLYYAMQLIHGQGLDLVIDDLKRLRAQSLAPKVVPERAADRSIAASLVAGQFAKEDLAAPGPDDPDATEAYEGSAPSSAVLPGHSHISTASSNRQAYFRSIAQIGVQTASALSYAHSRGIIHRDIKPGNLILDTTGNVWVTDFGLAKTGDSAMTHTGDILGTIRYMSPERFRGQCDVRADVYALGMTLYELLTLKPAFSSGDRLKLIDLIRHTEAASLRSVDARVPRDLETIVTKAIDKDPKRRYQSADELGEDLQRFVNDEPVKARRIGSVERLGRWCRRNPAVASLTAAVLALMALGTAVSTRQAVVANRARADLAARNAELAAEQIKVQDRFEMAAKAIETFHTGVSEEAMLKNDQLTGLRTKLLKQAAGFYADLEKLLEGQTDAKSRKTLAAGYVQLGDLTSKIGDQNEALAVHRKGLALRRELAAAPGADVETRLDVVRSVRKVGALLFYTGDMPGALRAWEEMREIAAALEAESPTEAIRQLLAQSQHSIGFLQLNTGKPAEALEALSQALAIRQKLVDANPANPEFQKDLAWSHKVIGQPLVALGKPAEALQEDRKALAIRQKLVADHPAVNQYRADLADTYIDIGTMLRKLGKPVEALEASREGLAIHQKLVDDNPAVTDFQGTLSAIHQNMGAGLVLSGQPAKGLESYRKSLAIRQKLVENSPANTDFQHAQASTQENIGMTLLWMGKPAEALESLRKSLPIRHKLVDSNPAITQYQERLANLHNFMGMALGRQKQFAEAFTALDAGLRIGQKLAEAYPKDSYYSQELGECHAILGAVRARAGQPAEAAADLRRALELWAEVPHLDNEMQLERSQVRLLAGLGADAKSGVTKDEAKTFADQSVAALAAVVKLGWALPSELKEPDFDALRGRADFQKQVAAVQAKADEQ